MSYQILHNPRCRKSREALAILDSASVEFEIIEYLKEPRTVDQLKDIIHKLGIKPYDLVRKGEAEYKENYRGKDLNDEQWIEAMVTHPKLMERPIVIKDDRAVLGRPPEDVKELL